MRHLIFLNFSFRTYFTHPHWAYLGRQIEEGPIQQAKVVLASTTVIRVTVGTQLDSLITILFEPVHHPDQPPDAIQSDVKTIL